MLLLQANMYEASMNNSKGWCYDSTPDKRVASTAAHLGHWALPTAAGQQGPG
jgi:hypothetical protein